MYKHFFRPAVVAAAALLIYGCSSTPSPAPDGSVPTTGLPLVDAALRVGAVDRSLESAIVLASAARVSAEAGLGVQALAMLDRAGVLLDELPLDQQLLGRAQVASALQKLAASDDAALERADAAADTVLDLTPRIDDAGLQAEALQLLFRAQLARETTDAEQIRQTVDLMYLIGDESVRVGVLLGAAELLAGDDDRISLNPLVQQSIAILPLIGNDVAAIRLSLGLAVLSDRIGRDQDRDRMLQAFDQRIVSGVPVGPAEVAEVLMTIDYLVRINDAARLFAFIEAIRPAAVAIRAATAGASLLSGGYTLALARARAVPDAEVRARALADIAYARAKDQPGRGPGDLVAEALNALPRSTANEDALVHIVANFSAAYLVTGMEAEAERLRGVLGGRDESGAALELLAQLLARDQFLALADEIVADMRQPSAALAVAIAEAWAQAGRIDRAVELLPRTVPAQLADRVAAVLLTPPGDLQPDAASVERLEAMRRES